MSFDLSEASTIVTGVTILESLVVEHRMFLKMFDRIERLLPDIRTSGEVAVLCRSLAGLIHDHGEEENDLAYIALDHILKDRGQHVDLYHAHQEIDGLLKKVEAVKSLPEARARLKAALDACRAHFDEEEHKVFPLIKRVLQPETLEVLGRMRKIAA